MRVSILLAAALVLTSCDGCTERLFPQPPETSGPVAYELGLVPVELRRNLRWPHLPRIQQDVELGTVTALNSPWTRSGVRLHVRQPVEQLAIQADDVEVVVGTNALVESLVILPGSERIRIEGGTYGQIVLEPPMLLEPPPEWRAADMIEDVRIEGVHVMAVRTGLAGILVRGRRIAILDSRVDAQFAAIYVGDTAPVLAEDVVIAGCSLASQGEEPTLLARDVRRFIAVANWIENPRVTSLRVQGVVEWPFASRNTLVGGGVAIGAEEGDAITEAWFWANAIHHNASDPVQLSPARVRELVLAGNQFFSDDLVCVWCEPTPDSWLVSTNRLRPYRAPPARP